MKITGVKEGDIVRVEGRLCEVLSVEKNEAKTRRRLRVMPCHGTRGVINVAPRLVEAHWKRMGRTQPKTALQTQLSKGDPE